MVEIAPTADAGPFPIRAAELTRERLTRLVRTVEPDALVEAFTVTDEKVHGSGEVSTAGRINLDLALRDAPKLAGIDKAVIKVARPEINAGVIYRNEVNFYTRVRPELDLEAARCLGGEYDEATGAFGLALEDLRVRGAAFPNVKTPVSLRHLRSLLDALAILHARFWESPRLDGELAFVRPHVSGPLHDFMNDPDLVPALIRHEFEVEQFKREMVQAAGTSEAQLYREYRKLQLHQSRLPQTICHGDTHIGNTYVLPGEKGGLLDWQLMARGYCLHDVTYLLITALSVEQRRAHERDLIRYYLDQLRARGVADAPDFDDAWLEHRRAAVWGVYIGWLTTPIENYGWDITVCNHVRLIAAYEDLETAQALADLPDAPSFRR